MGDDRQLVVRGVTKRFAGLTALDDVTLSVDRGEIVGLIGPNGSGKTTLVNVITGVLSPSSGEVSVDGRVVSGMSPHRVARAGVARTFQTVRLFGTLTVQENIALGALSSGVGRKEARKRAADLTERFGLGALRTVLCGALPYGQERVTEVARALATGCTYLLLDEPAAGLNEEESDALLGRLRTLPQEFDAGVLIIDHDMNLIMRLCDRLHVLNQGQTIAEGSANQVQHDPQVVEAYLGRSHAAAQEPKTSDSDHATGS